MLLLSNAVAINSSPFSADVSGLTEARFSLDVSDNQFQLGSSDLLSPRNQAAFCFWQREDALLRVPEGRLIGLVSLWRHRIVIMSGRNVSVIPR